MDSLKEEVGAQKSEHPSTQAVVDSLSVGPIKSEMQLSRDGLNVCCKWSPHHVIFSLIKRGTVTFYPLIRTRGSWSSSLSHSKLLQHNQLTVALHFTRNHGFWYCSRGRLLDKSSRTVGDIQDTWELGKYDENPITHVHFSPKKTQAVAPRPRPVRVLLPLCGLDLRSMVWWKGVSPKILITIELLSLGLLGDTMASLWKSRSIETCMT